MKISQREARRLQKRVNELQAELNEQQYRWAKQWPGGVNIFTENAPSSTLLAIVRTARALKHAVVVTENDQGSLYYYGCKL